MKIMEAIFPQWSAARQQARFAAKQYEIGTRMLEAIPSFAKDEDEGEWELMGLDKSGYTETDLSDMRKHCREMYYKDPQARNAVETLVNFVIGKNAAITPLDEGEAVKEWWSGFQAHNKWDMRVKEAFRRLVRDGEVFLRRFEPAAGENYRTYRFINPGEIKNPYGHGYGDHSYGIECDLDDIEKPVTYYRCWMQGHTERWERIEAKDIIHIKILCDSDDKRGVSFLVGIGGYMTKYNKWLEDRIKLNRIRNMFNLVGTPTGGSTAATVKGMFADTTGKAPTNGTENKRFPKPGSVLFSKGVEWEYKNLNINATDTADDGRAIQLMIGIGGQFPEYISRGDASNSNMASTMISESPFVRACESWQDFVEKPLKQIYREEIEWAIENGKLPKESKVEDKSKNAKGEEVITKRTVKTSTDCQIEFATLIHREEDKETNALVSQVNSGLCSENTAIIRLGYDPVKEREQMEKERDEREERMLKSGMGQDLELLKKVQKLKQGDQRNGFQAKSQNGE